MMPRWLPGLAVVLLGLAAPVQAQELDRLDSALKLVPADATFFSSWLRNREQLEIVARSKAWAKLSSLPAAQMAQKAVTDQLLKADGPLAPVVQFFKTPENWQLLELAGEMFAEEVFLAGGANFPDFVDLLAELQGANYGGQIAAAVAGLQGVNRFDVQREMLVQTLKENLKKLQAPELLLGFRVRDSKRAEAQIRRLEELARGVPQLKERLQRTRFGGGEFVTLTLEGTMIPWDLVPIRDLEQQPGELDDLVKHLKAQRLIVSVGVRDGYLLVSLGPTNHILARFGQDKRLVERPEFQKLAPHVDKRLTSISYTSQTLAEKGANTPEDIDEMMEWLSSLIPFDQFTAAQQARLKKDLADLAADVKKFMPRPGPSLGFTFLTPRGQEGYAYDWSSTPGAVPAKPLTILQHLGGNPILAVAGRNTGGLESYQLFVKWLKVAHGHFEDLFLPQLGDVKDQYQAIFKEFLPLVQRLDQITATMFLPALADGQSAFVLDAKWTSKQWLQALPATDKPMPMLEAAVVLGVSDAALLQKACTQYRETVNTAIAKIRQLVPDFPELTIPPPESRKAAGGTLFWYAIPEAAGLDSQVIPTAGLSNQFAVLTLSQGHAQRLLTATPLKVDGGPLADLKRPADSAVYFSFAALVEGAGPWIEHGMGMLAPTLADTLGMPGEKGAASIRDQTKIVLQVLQCLRSYSSRTTVESGITVTHSESNFRDVP